MSLAKARAESVPPSKENGSPVVRPAGGARPTWDVFISYAREDVEAARTLRSLLEGEGWKAFLSDDDLAAHVGSTPWSERIDEVLDASAVLVLLVTPHALDSKWVAYEWRSVHTSSLSGSRATVVPVCWEGPGPEQLPRALRRYQAIDARDEYTREQELDAVVALVRGCLTERRGPSGQDDLDVQRRGWWRWLRRRAAWMAAALALLGLGALARDQWSHAAKITQVPPPPKLPEAPRAPTHGLRVIEAFQKADRSHLPTLDAWDAAEQDFALAARQPGAPQRWSAARQLAAGMRALQLGEHAQAEAVLTGAIEIDPQWATPHVALSEVLVVRDPARAQEEAQHARRLDPELVIALDALGDAFFHAGNLERALEVYRLALNASPDSSARKGALALALHSADGAYDAEAERLAQEALDADPQLVVVRLVLADLALKEGRNTDALAQAQAALSLAPRDARAHLLLGDALQALGRAQAAREAWSSAREVLSSSTAGLPRGRVEEIVAALEAGRMPPRRFSPPAPAAPHKRSAPASPHAAPKVPHPAGDLGPDDM